MWKKISDEQPRFIMRQLTQLLLLATLVFRVDSWSLKHFKQQQQQQQQQQSLIQLPERRISRRLFIDATVPTILLTAISTTTNTIGSNAAAAESTTKASVINEVQQRLPLGHARVRYLLDHWDDITSVCNTVVMSDIERKQIIRTEGGGGSSNSNNAMCNKTPLRVQEFMGYKSTNDPLYKIDKLLIRVGNYNDVVDPDQYEAFISTVEEYRTTADATALLAYTSSWGEANPNGSKEVIDDYLDQTKQQVIVSEKLLRNMLQYLHISPLPPIQGKL